MYELIGILADVFIIVGFLFNSTKTIRSFNLVGCVLFTIYGIIGGAYSVVILNAIMILVNSTALIKEAKNERIRKTTEM